MSDMASVKTVVPFCWLSGMAQAPPGYCAPWHLHIAHIASGTGRARRVNKREAVILLSPICHTCHVSDADAHPSMTISGVTYPTIDERHTLWLKKVFDEKFYDRDYLQTIWIGRVPDPVRPPDFWCNMMQENQGIVL